LTQELPQGPIKVDMLARQLKSTKIGMGPAVASFSNASDRIAAAWADGRKREQGRAARRPAVLALLGGFMTDQHDFDTGLFGPGPGDRAMATDLSPPWDGVVAVREVGYTSGDDPVYYPSPHSTASIPTAIRRLATRRLNGTSIEIEPGLDHDVLAGLGFIDPSDR
jgi:hypothetical protein